MSKKSSKRYEVSESREFICAPSCLSKVWRVSVFAIHIKTNIHGKSLCGKKQEEGGKRGEAEIPFKRVG